MLTRRSQGASGSADRDASVAAEVELSRAADFQLGPLSVQPSTLQVEIDGSASTLEPRVMQVLVALAGVAGAVVSRDRLIDLCWSGRAVSEDAINRAIAKVRRLGSDSGAFEIETIPRVGYRLVPAGSQESALKPRRFGRALPIVLAAVLLTIFAGTFWYWRNAGGTEQPKIVVLPFAPLDSGPDTRNLGESIAATIGNVLVQTGARLPDDGVRTIEDARRAGAALIVSGTIRRDGSTVRVTTQVDSVRERTTILSNEWEGAADDPPALEARIAAWLVPAVRMWASFLPVESDPAITDEILRIFLTRSGGDRLRAWDLSRNLATTRAGSGSAQLVFALLTSDILAEIVPDQRQAAVLSARQAARSAARLLPDPDRALAVLDCHLTAPGWQILTPECDRLSRAAIAADPDVPLLPFLFASQLSESGRFVEAAKMVDMDLAQNPLGPGQLGLRIFITRMMRSGDQDGTLPELQARMQHFVGHGATAYADYAAAVANGEMGAAEALLNNPSSAPDIAPEEQLGTLLTVFRAVKSKTPSDVVAMRDSCRPRLGPPPLDPAFATCLVGLTQVGDLDAAFALATRGYRDVECCSAEQEQQWFATGGAYAPRSELFGKALAPLRADPRFIELARRTGLLSYWKSGHPPDFCSFERVPVCALLRSR